jgi:ABC-type transporter Mla subunit MlaD
MAPSPEPTLADVMAAIAALAAKVDGIDNKTDDLTTATAQSFGHVMTGLAGVKADIADVKNEVQKTEASLTERVADVQRVVRTLKSDLAGHVVDPTAHPHRHAA